MDGENEDVWLSFRETGSHGKRERGGQPAGTRGLGKNSFRYEHSPTEENETNITNNRGPTDSLLFLHNGYSRG